MAISAVATTFLSFMAIILFFGAISAKSIIAYATLIVIAGYLLILIVRHNSSGTTFSFSENGRLVMTEISLLIISSILAMIFLFNNLS